MNQLIPRNLGDSTPERSLWNGYLHLMDVVSTYIPEIDLHQELHDVRESKFEDAIELAFHYASETYLPEGKVIVLEMIASCVAKSREEQ